MVTFHLEEVPSNGGRAKSEVIFRDSDRRIWPSGALIICDSSPIPMSLVYPIIRGPEEFPSYYIEPN
jgi:hypothetical protein